MTHIGNMRCQQRNMRFTMAHIGDKAQLQAPWSNSHFLRHQDAIAKSAVRTKRKTEKQQNLFAAGCTAMDLKARLVVS